MKDVGLVMQTIRPGQNFVNTIMYGNLKNLYGECLILSIGWLVIGLCEVRTGFQGCSMSHQRNTLPTSKAMQSNFGESISDLQYGAHPLGRKPTARRPHAVA